MLITHYKNKEPIFDIAEIESTSLNSIRSSFNRKGEDYFSMVPEFSNDGGHLNELGRKKVAEQFLLFLANLY